MADAIPDMLAAFKRELTGQALQTAKQVLHEKVREHISEWFAKEVAGVLQAELATSLGETKVLGEALGIELQRQLIPALTAGLAERMKNSWERKKIFEALFAQ